MSKKKIIKKRFNVRIIVMGVVALSLIIGSVAWFAPTQGAGPTYFRFTIPKNADGTPVSYSPGWFGKSDKCPQNVTVLLYNDKEGYGIAYTADKFITKEATAITSSVADSTVLSAVDGAGVYKGQKLAERWLPEIRIESKDVTVKEGIVTLATKEDVGQIEQRLAIYCPVCGEFIQWTDDKVTDSRQVLVCPKGHKSVTATYEKVEALAK